MNNLPSTSVYVMNPCKLNIKLQGIGEFLRLCLIRNYGAYRNRNPRNFELMGLAPKTVGWEFQFPRKDFWHKCTLERGSNNTTGIVLHRDNGVVVSASTEENAISKYLYSYVDVSAAENIGRILAYRCLLFGITSLLFDSVEYSLTSIRNKAFYDALLDGGLCLEERSFTLAPEYGIDYDRLTDEEKRSLYPSQIEELRNTPDWGSQTYPFSLRPRANAAKKKLKYQALSKVRRGYVWDTFYNRMVKPENLASWQVELNQIYENTLGGDIGKTSTKSEEPVDVLVPDKWKLD